MFASGERRAQTPPQAPQSVQPPRMHPVSREQRMQRLSQHGAGAAPGSAADGSEHAHARLKRASRAIDEWSATRPEKSLWQSWTCACVLTSYHSAHAHLSWSRRGCVFYLWPLRV